MTNSTTQPIHEANTPDPRVIREAVTTDWDTLEHIYWTFESLALDLHMNEPPIERVRTRLYELFELYRAQLVALSVQDIVTELVVGDQDPEHIGHLASFHWLVADGDPVPNTLYRVEELTGFPDAQLEMLARRYEESFQLTCMDGSVPDEERDAA